MRLPGTEMHLVTLLFVCIEIVIFFYLIIYKLARPKDKDAHLNLILIFLLIIYNISGGLLPDPKLQGSFFAQNAIAYATGFITPSFFPYYVYKAFGLTRMKFHAQKGVFLFLIAPYLIFLLTFAVSGKLETAKNLLILPVLYALWVIFSLFKSIQFKYRNSFSSRESKEEVTVLLVSISPWLGVPVIDFLNLGQSAEASVTNIGFLLLFSLQLKRQVIAMRQEQERLKESEKQLTLLNSQLRQKVETISIELTRQIRQQANAMASFSQVVNPPLLLINANLQQYLNKQEPDSELAVTKNSFEKLASDIANLSQLEKLYEGVSAHNQGIIVNFSNVVKDSLILVNTMLQMMGQTERSLSEDTFTKNCHHYHLTPREIEIVQLIEKGQPHKEIGEALNISERTVATHLQNIFKKLSVSNKTEMIHKLKS